MIRCPRDNAGTAPMFHTKRDEIWDYKKATKRNRRARGPAMQVLSVS